MEFVVDRFFSEYVGFPLIHSFIHSSQTLKCLINLHSQIKIRGPESLVKYKHPFTMHLKIVISYGLSIKYRPTLRRTET